MSSKLKTAKTPANIITFTPSEIAILQHRLDVPEAIAGCLFDTYGWARRIGEKELTDMAEGVAEIIKRPFDALAMERAQIAILKDAVEGSTYFADTEDAIATGEITRGKAMSDRKAAYSIEEKLRNAGIACEPFPNH